VASMNNTLDLQHAPPAVAGMQFRPGGQFIPGPPPLPLAPVLPAPRLVDMLAVKAMRSVDSSRNGKLLAQAARSLLGQFYWMPRGPEIVAPVQGVPNVRPPNGTDVNGFDMWVRGGSPRPGANMILNCWEAVLVTAYEAGLLTLGQIRAAHDHGMQEAHRVAGAHLLQVHQGAAITPVLAQALNRAYDTYTQALDTRFFGSHRAIEVDLRRGLVPQAGDILFAAGGMAAHVCISLGRVYTNNGVEHHVASLWHHAGGRYAQLQMFQLTTTMPQPMRYLPCVF
jgi:hypothetical protein